MSLVNWRKMDKILEEIIKSLINRIEKLEEKINQIGKFNKKSGSGQATPGQLNYIKGLLKNLGIQGEDYSMLSKQEAGDYIEKLLEEKNKRKNQEKPNEFPKKVHEQIAEGSYDQNPLSQEEIDEIGEEALL
jgi:polyhydroxyalkanoate synthesis regulator phasin